MKPNPLYFFLCAQQSIDVIHKAGYIMVPLKGPDIKPTIQMEGQKVNFISHHLSMHDTYDEGTQYNSLYHYTANFDGFVVHVYFNRDGEQSDAYFKEETLDYKPIAQRLPDGEKVTIDQLMLNFSAPMIHRFTVLHADKINKLRSLYYQGLSEIRTRLFEHTMDMDGNLAKISDLIPVGESLKKISYRTRENHISLGYLQKQHSAILNSKVIVSPDTSEPRLLRSGAHDSTPPLNSNSRGSVTPAEVEKTVADISESSVPEAQENAQRLYQSFEASYDQVNALIQSYDTLLFNDFSGNIKILEEATPTLLDLLIAAESLMQLDTALMNNPVVLYKAGPGLDCLFHACQTKGTLLLTLCLLSTNERLRTFGRHLAYYAQFVSTDCVDSALRKGNVDALSYLVNHGVVEINRHQVNINSDKPMLSLICAAYQLGQLECFVELLKHNASVFALHDDELPLAHTLFNLPIGNPYRQAWIDHSPYFPDKTSQFFSIITPIVQAKLLFDPHLTSEKRRELALSLELYEVIVQGGSITASSKRITSQATQIAQRLDQTVLEKLRKSPEYVDRMRKTMHLSSQLSQILKKQKQESRFKSQSSLFFKNVNQQLDDSEFLQQQLHAMSKEQILQSMDANIAQLEDFIFVWTNQGKVLPKKTAKLLDAAVERIQAMQQRSDPGVVNKKLTQLISLLDDAAKLFATAGENFSKIAVAAQIDEEERELDFWDVAGSKAEESETAYAFK